MLHVVANAARLVAPAGYPDSGLPADGSAAPKVLVVALTHLEAEISKQYAEIAGRSKVNELARKPMTAPAIEPLIAAAIAILALPRETFHQSHDFATWLGLTPRRHSVEGKRRLGATTDMSERSLKRLLIVSAKSVIVNRHVHASARPGTHGRVKASASLATYLLLCQDMQHVGSTPRSALDIFGRGL